MKTEAGRQVGRRGGGGKEGGGEGRGGQPGGRQPKIDNTVFSYTSYFKLVISHNGCQES